MGEATSISRTHLRRQKLTLLLTVAFGHTLMHCFQQGWFIILPSIKQSFGISDVQYGAIVSTRALMSGLMNIPIGVVSDLLRRRWVSIITSALIGMGIAYLLLGIAPTYLVVLVAAGIAGISMSLWHPPALSTLSSLLPERRGLALSVHGMGGELGNTIGPLGLGFLIGAMAWQSASKILAIPVIILAVVLWSVLRNIPGREGTSVGGKQYGAAIKELLRNKTIIGIVISRGMLLMGTNSIFAFFSLYCQKDLEFSTFKAGLYFALLMGSGIVSQPIMGYLSDRVGRKVVIVPSLLLLGGFTMLLVWAGAGFGLMLVAICIGLFIYSTGAIVQAAAMDSTDEKTGALTIGLLFASSSLITIPSPMIAGVLSSSYGTPSVFLYSGSLIVLSAVIMGFLPMGRARQSAHK